MNGTIGASAGIGLAVERTATRMRGLGPAGACLAGLPVPLDQYATIGQIKPERS